MRRHPLVPPATPLEIEREALLVHMTEVIRAITLSDLTPDALWVKQVDTTSGGLALTWTGLNHRPMVTL